MILYVGNKLSKHGNTASAVETLGPLLSKYFTIHSVSDKVNKVHRLIDIVKSIVTNRSRIKLILIDTYSTQGFRFAFISARLALMLKIPYVLLLRGGNLEVRLRNSPGLSEMLFKSAAKLVAPSSFLYSIFKRYGYTNLIYIPNNLEIKKYNFKVRRTFRPKLFWVRSFSQIYNPTMAVNVVLQLSKMFTDVELCMVGPDKDGSLNSAKELARSLGIERNIKFKGKMEKPDWHKLSEEYDIFINTANIDNTPVSVMEAMALGLPIVSTLAGGIPYLIDDKVNGILVDINDTSAMVKVVKRLVDEPLVAGSLAENARAKISEFDWENIKHKWIDLINETI